MYVFRNSNVALSQRIADRRFRFLVQPRSSSPILRLDPQWTNLEQVQQGRLFDRPGGCPNLALPPAVHSVLSSKSPPSVLPVPELLLTKDLPLALTGGSDGHLVYYPSLHHWSSLNRRVSALVPSRARPTLTTLHSTLPSLYSIIGALYLSLSRELKRLDSVTRSPIFVAFGECLQGMYVSITLRPFHQIFPD